MPMVLARKHIQVGCYSRVHVCEAGEVDLVEHHDPALNIVLAKIPDEVVGRGVQVGQAWWLSGVE